RWFALPHRQWMCGQNFLQKLIELPGGNALRKRRKDLVDCGKQAAKGIRFDRRGEQDGRPGQKGKAPSEILFVVLSGLCVPFAQVPFVDEQKTGSALSDDHTGNLRVLLRHPFLCIEQEHCDIRSADRPERTGHTITLDTAIDLTPTANARGVCEKIASAFVDRQ